MRFAFLLMLLASFAFAAESKKGEELFIQGLHELTGEAGWADKDAALKTLKASMDAGDARAGLMYAMLLQEFHRSRQDNELGKTLKQKHQPQVRKMSDAGDAYAKAVLAYSLPTGEDEQGHLLDDAAHAGIAFAQWELAIFCFWERVADTDGMTKCFGFWCQQAAEQGHADAAELLSLA